MDGKFTDIPDVQFCLIFIDEMSEIRTCLGSKSILLGLYGLDITNQTLVRMGDFIIIA